MKMIKPQHFTATVTSKEKVSPKVHLVTFKVSEPGLAFQAGQTVMFQVAPGVNRSMSIASPPGDRYHFLMCHDVSPLGPFSQWTTSCQIGDTIPIVGPLGVFVLDKDSPRQKILVATGTGVAPFRSMLLDLFSPSHILPLTSHLSLYWGLRYQEDIFWQAEFEKLASEHPNFSFKLILSRPTPSWSGRVGHVIEHVISEEKNLAASDFYLCGNQQMVKDMEEALLSHDVPKEQIKKELFY